MPTKHKSDSEQRKELQAEVLATIGEFSAADRLKRDEIHKRPRTTVLSEDLADGQSYGTVKVVNPYR